MELLLLQIWAALFGLWSVLQYSWVLLENMYRNTIMISSGHYDTVSQYFYPFSFFYIFDATYEYYIEKAP